MKTEQLTDLVRDLGSLMMTTFPSGTPSDANARPMSVAKVDEDATVYFLTSSDTSQAHDVRRESEGLCTGQSKTHYVAMRGAFEVSYDRDLIETLWSKMADAWFPNGKDDPTVRVITFRPTSAEIWDMSGAKGLRFAFDLAKAWLTNEPPKKHGDTHAKVDLRH